MIHTPFSHSSLIFEFSRTQRPLFTQSAKPLLHQQEKKRAVSIYIIIEEKKLSKKWRKEKAV
jgi:hypothetical protein